MRGGIGRKPEAERSITLTRGGGLVVLVVGKQRRKLTAVFGCASQNRRWKDTCAAPVHRGGFWRERAVDKRVQEGVGSDEAAVKEGTGRLEKSQAVRGKKMK